MNVVCCQVEVSCVELITCPEEFYLLWCVVVCDPMKQKLSTPAVDYVRRVSTKV
jgi:hypothetical protein